MLLPDGIELQKLFYQHLNIQRLLIYGQLGVFLLNY